MIHHHTKNDNETFAAARRELYTAVLGDIMDQLGFYHQFLPPQIQPLRNDQILIGRAMTVLEADVIETELQESRNPVLNTPFGLMLEALDDLKPNEVYLCSGASPSYALWGELMTARAIRCGAAGAVLNGYIRDTDGVQRQKFPVFSHGSYSQDQAPRGKVIDYRMPLEIGLTRIADGQILFGDRDGVCAIPREAEEEIFRRAFEKARGEKTVKKAIESGMTAREAFNKYGIM